MKRIGKWLLITLLVLLLLVVSLLAAAAFLTGTDRGFGFLAGQIDSRVDALDTGELKGNLWQGLSSDRVAFDSATVAIEAKGLDSAWRLGCLLQRAFCVERLVIDELVVTLAESEQPAPPSGPREAIELPSIALPIDVSVDELKVNRVVIRPPGDAPEQVIENLQLAVHTEGDTVIVDSLSVDYQNYALAAGGSVELSGDYPLSLALAVDATDVIETYDARLDLALGNTLRQLELDATITGAVTATLNGQVEPLEPDLPLEIELSSAAVGWPLDSQSIAQAKDLKLSVNGSMDDYLLAVDTAVSGEQIPPTDVVLRGRANTERVNLPIIELDTLNGELNANAFLQLGEALTWHATLAFADIQPEVQFPAFPGRLDGMLTASGQLSEGNWSLVADRVHVDGTLRRFPLEIDARVSKSLDDLWIIDELQLENGANQIDIAGSVRDSWNIDGTLRLPELQNVLPQLAGGFQADLSVSGELAEPNVVADAQSTLVKFNDVLVRGVTLDAEVIRLAMADSQLNLKVNNVMVAGQSIDNIRLDADGSRAGHTLALFADGPEATSIDLTARGALDDAFNWNGSLESVELELPAHTINLAEPVALAFDSTQALFSVEPHCWASVDARLCLKTPVVAEPNGEARISFNGYTLDRLDVFLPAESELAGALSTDVTVAWGDAQPGGLNVKADIAVDDGGVTVRDDDGNPVRFNYRSLTLLADAGPKSIEVDFKLDSESLGSASADFTMNPQGEQKPVDGTIELSGLDISFVKAFLPQLDTVEGVINAEGTLSGQLSDPRFEGEIALDGIALDAEDLPLAIESGAISTFVRGRRAFIEGELATNSDGELVIDGSANWQQPSNWRAGIKINGEKLNIQQDPLIESSISPALEISARSGIVRIGGKVEIPMARIDVAELPQGATGLSDDVVVIEDIEPEEESASAEPPFNLQVGVDVILGDDVEVSAYGLEASLTGDMSVSVDSPNPPQLGGEIQVVDGVYKQYGQNLQADGQILFVGPVDLTRLDIEAIREIDGEDRIAGLHITGTVEEPEISLFTEPADKSEEAILSYIVFGRDISEASDQEANLLAAAALALTVRGGRTIGSGIADRLGIEEFALETRGRGDDTEVVVSGRLNDRLLLRYGQSVFDPQQTLYLRYDLSKKLYLEAAQGLERAVDLFYSFSF